MKKLMSITMIALLATVAVSIASPDKEAMMAKEKAAWQAYKDKKSDEFKKLISPDFIGVYADGILNFQKEMEGMQKSDLKSFSLSDYAIVSSGPDVMMTTYKVTMQGASDGKDISGSYKSGSVWKQQNGEWRAIFHTNVKEQKAD
jgi:hypothetical protein